MANSDRTVRIALPVYVDIKAVTGGSGAQIPADSYTPADEQQRLGDLAQNARDIGNTLFSAHKGSGQVAGACLVLWSLIVSWQEGAFEDEEEGADWSKIIGSSISLAGGAMAGIEGYHKIRMASLGLSTEGAMIGGVKWAFVSDVLGAAGGMISIWDGLKKLTEANEASKTGQSLTGHYGMIVGGVGVIAGIASIVVISASTVVGVFVGLFVGLVTLLVGFIFVTMVSPAVQMWVNRSILGKPSAQQEMQVLPFDDMASEQGSLEMVFQGVLVELSWEPVRPNPANYMGTGSQGGGALGISSDASARQAEEERVASLVRIETKVEVPSFDSFSISVRLYDASGNDLVSGSYFGDKNSLTKKRGRDSRMSKSDDGDIEVVKELKSYTLKASSQVSRGSGRYSLDISLFAKARSITDTFTMEI
ncbi:hypothetical protein QO259_05985 [Salinicola sp. JS01]|uniref:hypothetical protein n=1 Tax=Salinicola sp. JS01 TaxID=3050071 RepID=UPI00255C1BFD|nr:hypothetical protein [Salinicola sp. JS01]WIX34213.1 hypothetical protein QO259_05985 [Salinicola sp. JS01]